MSDPIPASTVVVASAEPPSCVRVVPDHFRIEVVLHEEVFLELTLLNTSSSLCTFKVKTTARDRYLLRPTQDYIPAGGSKVCKIVMSALRTYPDLTNPKNLKDKFLVQATNIAGEVPDLTKFWKDLETQHNPKAGLYKYAETKIKCKLSIPAKYRAADATKRGLEEEAAATAAAMASAGGSDKNGEQQMVTQQQMQSQPMQSQPSQPRSSAASAASDDLHGRRKMSDDDDMSSESFAALALADPVASHSATATAATSAAPSSSAASAAPSSISYSASTAASTSSSSAAAPASSGSSGASVAGSQDAQALARALKASESKYAELMAFVVTTTQQLETERQDKESWEARAQAAGQSLAQALAKLETSEAKLREAREEAKRVAQSGGGSSLLGDEGKMDSEGVEGANRRRNRLDGTSGGSGSGKTTDDASSKSSASSSAASSLQSTSSSALSSSKKPQSGLALTFWQIALMALVCFVLGRIFA